MSRFRFTNSVRLAYEGVMQFYETILYNPSYTIHIYSSSSCTLCNVSVKYNTMIKTSLAIFLVLGYVVARFQQRSPSPPPGCNLDLCTCTDGEPMCARNLTGVYMQYPKCLQLCFFSCCRLNEAPYDIHRGECRVPYFAKVLTEPFRGTVGLVEACPGIYFAAIDGTTQ